MMTANSFARTVLRQRNRLSRSIQAAATQEELERLQHALEAVTPLWEALGYQEALQRLHDRLARRAARVLLSHQEELTLFSPGKGLWQSARSSISRLGKMVRN